MLDACGDLGIGFLPFYPLANGLLTGKVRPGEPLPEGTRLAKMPPERSAHWLSDEFQVRVRVAARLRRGHRRPDPLDRLLVAAQPPGGLVGDRRSELGRADSRQRGSSSRP